MSQLVATLFWILLVILGAGILGWLLSRFWSREGFRCGAGAHNGGHHGDGGSGHSAHAHDVEIDAHGNPVRLGDDARYGLLLAERDALAQERDALRLKAEEGDALRARFLGGADFDGSASVEGEPSGELLAARARIAELEGEATDLVLWRTRAEEGRVNAESAYAELEKLRAELSAAEEAAKDGAEDLRSSADSEAWGLRQDLEEARARIAELENASEVEEAARLLSPEASASLARGEESLLADLAAARARIVDLEDRLAGEAREVVRYVWREGDEEADAGTGVGASAERATPAAFASLRAELEEARARLSRISEDGEEPSGSGVLGFAASGAAGSDLEALRAELFATRNRLADAEAALNAAQAEALPAESELTAARARLVELEAEAQAAKEKAAALEGEVKTLVETNQADEEGALQAKTELDRLRRELEAALGRVDEVEAREAREVEGWRVKFADLEGGSSEAKIESEAEFRRLHGELASLTGAKRAADEEIGQLRLRLAEAEQAGTQAAEASRVKLVELEAGSADSSALLDSLRAELEAARLKLRDLDAQGAEEKAAWELKFADLQTGSSEAATESEAEFRRLHGELASLTGAKRAADEEIGQLRLRLAEAEQAGTQAAEASRVKLVELEAGSADSSALLDSLRAELEAARLKLRDLDAQGAEEKAAWELKLSGAQSETEAELARLRGELTAAQGRIGELEGGASEEATLWKTKFADLESGSSEAKTESEAEFRRLHGELASLTGAKRAVDEELGRLRLRLAEAEAAAAASVAEPAAESESDALRIRIARLEAGASSSSSEIELLQSQLRSARGRVSELEASASNGGAAGGALGFASLNSETSAELDALRLDLRKAHDRIAELKAQGEGGTEIRTEIREVIRYVERPAAEAAEAEEEAHPFTDEEREAQELIRSGARDFSRPTLLLSAPRAGEAPDDLKLIRGVGPKLEGLLHENGIYYFEQLAAFTPRDIAWIDGQLEEFPGRILRDRWVPQAREFARLKGVASSGAASAAPKKSIFAEVGETPAAPKPAPKTVSAELTQVEAEALRLIDSGENFEGLEGFAGALPSANRGEPDDLKRIRGVAYKLEEQLHELGIYYFDQIAEMSPAEAAWLDWRLGLRGRVIRYRWIAQAQVFAAED
ncbi:hypothetical protein [Neomegalonema perideroedes]|uniref:hypothetical protein n=1 Tax=Neomegalonema perideroedes TaxID=217219 RepID=UPI000379C24C|nr:hypothetical protein [Neomegalonema perideroedes]